MIGKLIQYIYTGWCGIMFVIPMVIFSPFMVIPLLISRKLEGITFFFIRCWVYMFSLTTGIWFVGHNKKSVDTKKSFIFLINHTSFLDACAIPVAIPSSLVGLGKKELSKIPVFGWVTSRFAVWVDRSSPESRKEGITRMKELLSGGTSVLVAPEGTRNNTEETLLPFRHGPFRLAIESNINIIPVVIHRASKLMKRGSLLLKPGVVHSYVLPEVSVEGMTESDVERLAGDVFKMMKDKIVALDESV
ncbi:lysophospholipid acyltransferase family protein [Roseivirga sp.]|uniref:lysophospholipid acyltransferase family protein n=1 Tax=Roseivirga sp. TaxID=1964215 RepID=UPI003B8D397C